jgi:cytochrome oxidase Cu insertion factor (SCO1/SenC/PrrC family)
MPAMRSLIALPVLVLLLSLPLPAGAQDDPLRIDVSALGPQVGERVPDFRLADQTGTERTLQSLMGRRGLMLVFVRSADW